jgi:hypothetical protein
MDAADFADFWLRHQRMGTRSTSNLFPARALTGAALTDRCKRLALHVVRS